MRSSLFFVLLATFISSATAHAADLVLKRAVLGTGGVGYFEYSAEVTGAETLTLRARLDQVDDILKSLIILDPAGTGSATLPGKAGAEETFASLPFNKADLDNLPALIGVMKGAEIRLAGPRKLEGRIASVQSETVTGKDGQGTTRTRVSLFAGAGLEQFILEEAEGLSFADARLGEQVDTALKALRAAQDRSGRDIAIKLAEGGKRTIRIGYVAETPVWKAAYRLTLPKPGEDKARLQGWVVLENMTGNPWRDVAVTLSSAAPVTFREALYDPYYVTRPKIAPPVSRAALPRTDQGQNLLSYTTTYGGGMPMEINKADMAPAQPAPQPAKNAAMFHLFNSGGELTAGYARPTAPEGTSEENTSGASFTLALPVSVSSGESLTIPFIDLTIPSDAVAWYQVGLVRNPWHALALKNDSQTSLPAGSATLYEDTDAGPLFSGEAQFPMLPAGDSRLIGFGTDQKVLIDHEQRSATVFGQIKIVKGMVHIESRVRDIVTFRVKNGERELRHMVIERPRMQDWTLVAPASATLASGAYRMRIDVAGGQSATFEVILERSGYEELAVGDVTGERVAELMASDGLDAETKARLAKVAEAAAASGDAEQAVTHLEEQRKEITGDQDRLRENLRSAPSGSDLARLYSQKMLAQENSLDGLDAELKAARSKRDAARKTLEEQVLAL